MATSLYAVEAVVRSDINNGYRLKVSALALGLYIDGWRVTRSDRGASKWWVQPPATNVHGKWKPVVEFDKSNGLWQEIEQACVDAVTAYAADGTAGWMPTDDELSDASIAAGIDKAFGVFTTETKAEIEDGSTAVGKAVPWKDKDEYDD